MCSFFYKYLFLADGFQILSDELLIKGDEPLNVELERFLYLCIHNMYHDLFS